jgi:hypothetical protein
LTNTGRLPFHRCRGRHGNGGKGNQTDVDGVDYYSPLIDEDVVHSVEIEMKSRFGKDFKIDATPGENLWGPILFRDIAQSGQVEVIKLSTADVPVRALSAEDLILVKIAADREKIVMTSRSLRRSRRRAHSSSDSTRLSVGMAIVAQL